MEPLESHILFVASDGRFAVGAIDEIDEKYGKYVQTQSDTFFQPNWTHVVAVGPHILFVRHDGLFEVGHIDQGNPAVGLPRYVNTEGPKPGFSTGWTHIVAVGPNILFVNSDTGRFAVGHIDEYTRQYVNTESSTGFSTGWTHVVAVGPNILFVDSDTGQFEVGHINLSTGTFKSTAGPKPHPAFVGATHVVVVGSYILSGRANAFEVGYIDEATGDYVHTQSHGPGDGGFPGPDPFHLVAVGPHVLGVSPTMTLGFVGHISTLGQVAETHSGPPFASDWTHVVAVA